MTVGGLGERAGNAALEEVAAALESLRGLPTGIDLKRLPALAAFVAQAARRALPEGKAIVGRDVFTHESGIHVAGLLADPETHRGADPALFGRRHRIAIGKHSGARALAFVLQRTRNRACARSRAAAHRAGAAQGRADQSARCPTMKSCGCISRPGSPLASLLPTRPLPTRPLPTRPLPTRPLPTILLPACHHPCNEETPMSCSLDDKPIDTTDIFKRLKGLSSARGLLHDPRRDL